MRSVNLYSTFLLLIIGLASAVLYVPPSCETKCKNPSNFILPLPVETGPVDNGDNRAYAWSIVALIQLKINFRLFGPPQNARAIGIFSTCFYEGAAVTESYLKSSVGFEDKIPGRSSQEIKDAAIDGAAYWALKTLFGDQDSFSQVAVQFEAFAGFPLSELFSSTDVIDAALRSFFRKKTGFKSHVNRQFAAEVGIAACKKVIETYTSDGFTPRGAAPDGDPTDFQSINSPQMLAGISDCDSQVVDLTRWQPLCVPNQPDGFGTDDCNPQMFAVPWAGRFTTFALVDGDETTGADILGPPPAGDSDQFREEYEQVLEFSATLGDEYKTIAEYWADGPGTTQPPGHVFRIAADAALSEELSTSETARLLLIVGSALNDAGIASWRTKTTYDFARPLSMLQCGDFRGVITTAWQGPYMGVGPVNISEWRPYQDTTFVTPPFSAYTSGHSTFSSAASEALKLFFGSDDYLGPPCDHILEGESLFEPRTDAMPGITDVPNTGPDSVGYAPAEEVVLCWDQFSEFSTQSGDSRLLGGIHVRADDVGGKTLGRKAGREAFAKASTLVSGKKIIG